MPDDAYINVQGLEQFSEDCMSDRGQVPEESHIRIPVPPQIAAAWQALPAERQASLARAIVEAWLEPMLLRPMEPPVFVPYHTVKAAQAESRQSAYETFQALCRQLGIPYEVRAYTADEITHDALPYYAPEVLHQARWACVLGQTTVYFDQEEQFLGLLGDPHECGWWPRQQAAATDAPRPRREPPLPALETLSDDALAQLIHQAEDLLEACWPAPPLTADTAALFETDRQHPETNAALYDHDFYRWCAQTAHRVAPGVGLCPRAP
jgi:hypothetical protein